MSHPLALSIDSVRERFPDWKIGWEYGEFHAVHDDFEASWEGEEDGWVGNGLQTSARDLESLCEEIEAIVVERDL